MKKLSMMIMAACLLLLASCSLKPKSIAPASTKFDGGKLATLVELVGTEGELSFEETEAAIPAQIIRLKTKLKLNEETAKLGNTLMALDCLRVIHADRLGYVMRKKTC